MDWMGLLGRLHVVVVHFPIALLIVAGGVELWRGARRKAGISPLAAGCIYLGAITSVVAMALGWIHQKDFDNDELLAAHRWLGIATTIASIVSVLLLLAYQRGQWWAESVCRLGILLCAVLVSATGYFGGELTHGVGFLTHAPHASEKSALPATAPSTTVASDDEEYEFTEDIYPILKENCINCHRYGKQRGGLKLDSVRSLLKGGKSGPAIVVGQAEKSLIISRLRGLGGKDRMPKDKPALSEKQIESISEWIDSGAK